MVQIDIDKPKRCFDCLCYDSMHKECLFGPPIDNMNGIPPDCPMKEVDGDENYETFIDNLLEIDKTFCLLSDIRNRILGVCTDFPIGDEIEQWIRDGFSHFDLLTVCVVRQYLQEKGLTWRPTKTGDC